MDGTTKLFIFMLIFSLMLGFIVYLTHPDYRVKNIYESNKNYYPQITDKSIESDIKKLFNK